jgi:anti-sigma factor RsiW
MTGAIRRWFSRGRDSSAPLSPPPLSCQELVELVTDYLEGALDGETRLRFEEHLAVCDGCTAYVAQIEETARLVGHLEEEHLSEPARTKLLGAFRDWNASGS